MTIIFLRFFPFLIFQSSAYPTELQNDFKKSVAKGVVSCFDILAVLPDQF